MKILHITAHLGGGVGTVVLNYLREISKKANEIHQIISLDEINKDARSSLNESGIFFIEKNNCDNNAFKQAIEWSDIVLVHWWNHPMMTELLINFKFPKCRMLLWAHISGSTAPNNFTKKLFYFPDILIFTTPLSYLNTIYCSLDIEIKSKVRCIWSTAGVERIEQIRLAPHEGFNVGYIGNLDYSKIHPNFIKICESIDVPDIRFTVIGPLNETLHGDAIAAGLQDKITFTDFIPEQEKWRKLSEFDLFGYPLARHHYGTCDQALQEAMAAGVPPVVLSNPMETYMVKNGVSGLVVPDENSYISAIKSLYYDHKRRKQLSEGARIQAKEKFNLKSMIESWNSLFSESITTSKRSREWTHSKEHPLSPHEVFLESLGNHAEIFKMTLGGGRLSISDACDQLQALGRQPEWSSKNKSTVHQFKKFFPHDKKLQFWSNIMLGERFE
jgi:glycosyltransferase involved in cell wall biosynthesis